MALPGKTVTVEAPVMIVDNTVIWMEQHWLENFMAWLKKEKLKITGWECENYKLKVEFVDAKMATVFGLKYGTKK